MRVSFSFTWLIITSLTWFRIEENACFVRHYVCWTWKTWFWWKANSECQEINGKDPWVSVILCMIFYTHVCTLIYNSPRLSPLFHSIHMWTFAIFINIEKSHTGISSFKHGSHCIRSSGCIFWVRDSCMGHECWYASNPRGWRMCYWPWRFVLSYPQSDNEDLKNISWTTTIYSKLNIFVFRRTLWCHETSCNLCWFRGSSKGIFWTFRTCWSGTWLNYVITIKYIRGYSYLH